MIAKQTSKKAVQLLACGLFLFSGPAIADEIGRWLERMAQSIDTSSYTGIAIRQQDSSIETLIVRRAKIDGVLREYLKNQEGPVMEFIRSDDEVQCAVPDKKAVLVDRWTSDSMLFTTIPNDPARYAGAYQLKLESSDRVAGRTVQAMFVEPQDKLRFAHRLWLDVETGFPLRTQVINSDDTVISEIRFAQVQFDPQLSAEDFTSEYEIDAYRWVERTKLTSSATPAEWVSEALPVGFQKISIHQEALRGKDSVIHILYSDGLSSVSVFVEPDEKRVTTTRSRVGGANSYSTTVDGYRVTAVGEVPAATTERIALSMRKQ